MTRFKIVLHHLANFTLLAWFLAAPLFILIRIEKLEHKLDQSRVVIYKVDNRGGAMDTVGKVTDKQVVEGHYTVTIGAYGKFLVTKEQYDSINIGDDVPEYLKERGS